MPECREKISQASAFRHQGESGLVRHYSAMPCSGREYGLREYTRKRLAGKNSNYMGNIVFTSVLYIYKNNDDVTVGPRPMCPETKVQNIASLG